MGVINVNLEDVPTQRLEAEPGIYEAEIIKADLQEIDTKKGKMNVLDLMLRTTHTEDSALEDSIGRTIFHRSFVSDFESNLRELKRLALSVGIEPDANGLRTEDLEGQVSTIRVSQENYQSKEGEQRTRARVADFIPPEERQ